jgi:hypothetical protein
MSLSEQKRVAPKGHALKCVRVFTTADGGTSLEDIEIPCDGTHPLGWMSVVQKSTQVSAHSRSTPHFILFFMFLYIRMAAMRIIG